MLKSFGFNYMAQDIFKQSPHSQAIVAPVLMVGLVLEVTAGPGKRFQFKYIHSRCEIPGQDNAAAVQVVHSQGLAMDHSLELEVLLVHNQGRILDHHAHNLGLQILQLVQLDQIRNQT